MAASGFADFVLDVDGLVEQPLHLTLAELRTWPRQTQITKHNCIQGWSAVAEWSGISLAEIVRRCRPLREVRFVVLHALDDKSTSEPDAAGPGRFYGTIDIALAAQPQTMLAFEMNGAPLPVVHGAPLRLRAETQLGFVMVKYIARIEFVASYAHLGAGQGGWREDHQFYSQEAGI
jgi:DMSO/TMAO reductase YedYZ molybdopterin-dependent catalytic subunit